MSEIPIARMDKVSLRRIVDENRLDEVRNLRCNQGDWTKPDKNDLLAEALLYGSEEMAKLVLELTDCDYASVNSTIIDRDGAEDNMLQAVAKAGRYHVLDLLVERMHYPSLYRHGQHGETTIAILKQKKDFPGELIAKWVEKYPLAKNLKLYKINESGYREYLFQRELEKFPESFSCNSLPSITCRIIKLHTDFLLRSSRESDERKAIENGTNV